MGLCGSKDSLSPEEALALRNEKAMNKALDNEMAEAQGEDGQVNKLLLLGAGESGKSTLFKQMIAVYGEGFPIHERRTYATVIANNVISSIKTLLENCDHFSPVGTANAAAKEALLDAKGDEPLDGRMAQYIADLWADPGVQATYSNRAKFQLFDSAAFFFTKVLEMAAESYVPTQQDVLRCRVRTTGIVENSFTIDGNLFKMYDVGGQRNERKKWIHCFEEVTAVLFVAAISEYDQVLYEDENTNRMLEALTLFEEICNSRWFRKTAMILFLNKRDLFAEKIKKVPLNTCASFAEYDGPNEYDACTSYITDRFLALNKHGEEKHIYTHVTCATDTSNVEVVFGAVKDIIIRQSVQECGLY